MKNNENNILTQELVINSIYQVRGIRVMFDFDLAELYQVETRALKQSVKRNISRFPGDFLFILTKDEWKEVITKCDNLPDNIKFSPALPMAFTELGVSMLSSVLKSERAIAVNIQIMRVFHNLSKFLLDHAELKVEIEVLKKGLANTDKNLEIVFQYIEQLAERPVEEKPRKRIGYKPD